MRGVGFRVQGSAFRMWDAGHRRSVATFLKDESHDTERVVVRICWSPELHRRRAALTVGVVQRLRDHAQPRVWILPHDSQRMGDGRWGPASAAKQPTLAVFTLNPLKVVTANLGIALFSCKKA